MQRFDASERAVRAALDHLHRTGRITRRQRAGTFVADIVPAMAPSTPDLALLPPELTDSRTLVAIVRSDHSFNDRCLDLLCRHAEAANLGLACKLFGSNASLGDMIRSVTSEAEGDTAGEGNRGGAGGLGFVVFGHPLAPLARHLQARGERVVIFGAPPLDTALDVPFVYGDHEQGGYLVTRHLIELGHRRLAFLHPDDLTDSLRWRGHERAMTEAQRQGINVECEVIRQTMEYWKSHSKELVALLRERSDAPTGLICWNDHEAVKLLSILQRSGVRVPEEISLTGYDDLPEGRNVFPALTTVDHGIGQQLRAAVDLLTRPQPHPSAFVGTVVPTLICRESTAEAAADRPTTSRAVSAS